MQRIFTMLFTVLAGFACAQTTDVWVAKAPFPDTAVISTFAFTIGNVAYYGTGYTEQTCDNHFWAYDGTTDTWAQKTDAPNGNRTGSQAFALNGMGYMCMGTDCSFDAKTDIWQYDPTADTWTQKSNFPGSGRRLAVAFGIGSYGYLGTGANGSSQQLADFWQYDPDNDTWTQKADFAGTARANASGWGFDTKGYICLGIDANGPTHDIWEYDVTSNNWTQKANFQGVALGACEQFSIGGKGYIASGSSDGVDANKKELWEYDTASNTWSQRASMPVATAFGSGFNIGNNGYVVGGEDSAGQFVNNLWQYTPLATGIAEPLSGQDIVIGPNPFNNQLMFKNLPVAACNNISMFNCVGQCIFTSLYSSNETTISLPESLAPGVYVLQVINNLAPVAKVKLVKQ